ncbi:MAG TPA: DUF4388 domain-containing protein, partial [Ktedonobacterales bacterium]
MQLAGNLRQYALTDVLRVIESGQRTGMLLLSKGKLRAAIYFSGGQWLLAERLGSGLVLAQQLERVGLVSRDQFEAALGVPFVQAGSLTDVQVVRALIGAGLLTQEQLRTFAVDDAVALLTVVLGWPDGEFVFEEGIGLQQGRVALPLPVAPLVTQAMRFARVNAPAPREVVPLAPESVIAFAEVDPESRTSIQLTRDQWKLLTAVDGQLPLWAIVQRLQAPEATVLRLAAELVASGVAVVVGRAAQPS